MPHMGRIEKQGRSQLRNHISVRSVFFLSAAAPDSQLQTDGFFGRVSHPARVPSLLHHPAPGGNLRGEV